MRSEEVSDAWSPHLHSLLRSTDFGILLPRLHYDETRRDENSSDGLAVLGAFAIWAIIYFAYRNLLNVRIGCLCRSAEPELFHHPHRVRIPNSWCSAACSSRSSGGTGSSTGYGAAASPPAASPFFSTSCLRIESTAARGGSPAIFDLLFWYTRRFIFIAPPSTRSRIAAGSEAGRISCSPPASQSRRSRGKHHFSVHYVSNSNNNYYNDHSLFNINNCQIQEQCFIIRDLL